MQEDPFSGLIGDSWRLPDEKAQFRLELQRMVSVSCLPPCVTGPLRDMSMLPVLIALPVTAACRSAHLAISSVQEPYNRGAQKQPSACAGSHPFPQHHHLDTLQ